MMSLHESHTQAKSPGSSYGSSIRLRADKSPQMESYLRFTNLPSSVSRARLRLFVTEGTGNGPALYAVNTNWTEGGLTWNSRPARLSRTGVLGDLGKVATDTWAEFDVTGFVRGRSTVAFQLKPASADGMETISSESTQTDRRPQLVIDGGTPTPPPPPRPPTPPPAPATPPTSGRPNVLFFVMDDMRADFTLDVMPATRRWLVDGGTTFTEGFATTPLCCPSRSTLFSGRYMHNHTVYNNGEAEKLDQRYTIQCYLKDAGYQSAMTGKFLTGWNTGTAPPNFDHYALTAGGYTDATFNVDGRTQRAAYSTDFIRDRAVDFLGNFEADDARPWFLYVTPQAPHRDFTPAPRHKSAPVPAFAPSPGVSEDASAEKADKVPFLRSKNQSLSVSRAEHDGQLRTLMAVDEMVDAVFRRLEATGELANTLVVFTSDNGFFWGEHGVGSKGLPYTESVKVPFLVRWEGHVPAGQTDTRLVAGVDLMPTVLAATGTRPAVLGYPHDGRDILAPGGRDRILLEFHAGHHDYPSWASIRTATTQYLEYYGGGDTTVSFREYYDLVADRYQLQNVLADGNSANDPDVGALSSELARHRRCGGVACP
jgi:arylsulfatase A-like enzyme